MTTQLQFSSDDIAGLKSLAASPSARVSPSPAPQTNEQQGARGSLSLQVQNGVVTDVMPMGGSHSLNASDLIIDDGTLLSTATSPSGNPTKNYTDSTIVKYQGMEIDLKTAATLGLVQKQDGKYTEVKGANNEPISTPEAQERETDADREAYISDEFEGALGGLAEALPMAILDSAINKAITQGVSGINVNEMAANAGLDTPALQNQISFIENGFRTQASSVIAKAGIEDEEGFIDWVETNHMGRFQDAQRHHVLMRDTSGYKELAALYMRSTYPASAPQGMETKKDGNKLMVNHPQFGWVENKVLARMGEI